jgi:hypothetical protein
MENEGKIKDIPLVVRKHVYDCLKTVDFDEVDKEFDGHGGDGCIVIKEEFKNVELIVLEDSIMVFVRMFCYDLDLKELSEDKILTFKIKRDEIEGLCKC